MPGRRDRRLRLSDLYAILERFVRIIASRLRSLGNGTYISDREISSRSIITSLAFDEKLNIYL